MQSQNGFFPSNRAEMLAVRYVELHISQDMTPEDIVDLYLDAVRRISQQLDKRDPAPPRPPRRSLV